MATLRVGIECACVCRANFLHRSDWSAVVVVVVVVVVVATAVYFVFLPVLFIHFACNFYAARSPPTFAVCQPCLRRTRCALATAAAATVVFYHPAVSSARPAENGQFSSDVQTVLAYRNAAAVYTLAILRNRYGFL